MIILHNYNKKKKITRNNKKLRKVIKSILVKDVSLRPELQDIIDGLIKAL